MIEYQVWNLIDHGLDNSHRPPVGRRRPIIAYSFVKATLHIAAAEQGLYDIHEVHRSTTAHRPAGCSTASER